MLKIIGMIMKIIPVLLEQKNTNTLKIITPIYLILHLPMPLQEVLSLK